MQLLNSIIALGLLTHYTTARQCIDISIPVNLNARQAIFDQVLITDNFVATQFALNLTNTRGSANYSDSIVRGYQTVSGKYNIGATFCRPVSGIGSKPTLQLLIHGIGFDKS